MVNLTLTVVLLDNDENLVKFLDPDFVDITETVEKNKLRLIKFEYTMQDISDARKLFKLGYKLWISGDDNLTDCLYVISNEVKRDYFKENTVSFEAEEVLVELNYAPLFSQTDLTEANGFTITTVNDEENVLVDYNALVYWFGAYFNIGVVQDCLSAYVSRIVPGGTMTLMELLRFIEEETSNIFVTRYEKDTVDNTIHRYLDFLNPNKNDKRWELNYTYKFPEEMASAEITLYDDEGNPINEGTIITEDNPEDHTPIPGIDVDSCYFKLTTYEGKTLFDTKATSLGLTTSTTEIRLKITYNNSQLTIQLQDRVWDMGDWTNGQNAPGTPIDTELGNNTIYASDLEQCIFEVYDDARTWYHRVIDPTIGTTHHEVLDLAYNVENIEYYVDETDTFTAVSPVITGNSKKGERKDMTKQNIDTIINNWLDLNVWKGEVIPMIVEKTTMPDQPTDEFMSKSDTARKYYSRPINPSDSDDAYEYWKGSAYWTAPFTKRSGQMHILNEEDTGTEYTLVNCRPDIDDLRCSYNNPKTGTVSTSEENCYNIYNDVAMQLKDIMYPEITVEVDIANIINHKYNDYCLHDTVYVKVPGFEKVITAVVTKTEKNCHDINKNKITLGNYSINAKVAPKQTYVTGENVSFTYPETSSISCTLWDEDDNKLADKLITFALYSSNSFKDSYTRITDKNGSANIPLSLEPGNYTVTIQYGGDAEYSSTSQSYEVLVGGTVEKNDGSNTTTTSRYWTKYGVSPDGTKILAIGKPSASGESRYGYTFYKSEFVRRCPHCGSNQLYWYIFWAGNETSNWGRFPATGRNEGGSAEGHIFCAKCDADYSCILGREHVSNGRSLTRVSGPVKVSKTDAYKLRSGQYVYDTQTTTVSSSANTATRAGPIANISERVKQKGISIAGASTGLDAAKKIAQWCGTNIKYADYSNFIRSADTVLSMGSGNCCDQTRLMLQMMDGAGVTSQYQLIYVHVVAGHRGHVFAKINGTYVDPCKAKPWGNYVTGYGVPGSAPNSVYPKLPF